MTNSQRIVMHFILAALLFVGSESSKVENSSDSEVFLNQLEDAKAQRNMTKKPSLQPKESTPVIQTYALKKDNRICAMVRLGVVFVVKENKKTFYFNLDPKSTSIGGYCAEQKAVISLDFNGGYLQFTLTKNGDQSYVSTVKALLEPEPTCVQCKANSYPGILDHEKLFKTKKGNCFKCQSKTKLKLADNLTVKLVPLQLQAFDLSKDIFGKETECWADYAKRILPIVVGTIVAAIILTSVLVYVLMRERRGRGYEQL